MIVSINLGLPALTLLSGNRKIRSAIFKKPAQGKIFLDYLGFDGDGVGDLLRHGGVDKAVCAYSSDHFRFWEMELATKLSPGAFGENLTFAGMTENEVCIGDIFRIGGAEIQCSQPREPCHKLIKIFDYPAMARKIQETGFSGYYLRVIKQGWVESGATVKQVRKDSSGISVEAANKLMYHDKKNFEKIRELLQVDALSTDWRKIFSKRLDAKKTPRTQGTKA